MTSPCQAWLPPLALFDGVLAERIGAWTNQWEASWFAAPKDVSMRASTAADKPAERAARWGVSSGGVALAFEEAALPRLACALLCVRRPARKNTLADARLLRSVAEACLSDLVSRLASGLGLSQGVEPFDASAFQTCARHAAMRFAVNVSALGRPFDVYLSQDAAVDARKAAIQAPRDPRPLGARRSAVEAQEIRVEACVGWGKLDVAELRSLAPDDVVVLDAALGKDMILFVNGRQTTDPSFELVQRGSSLALRERRITAEASS